MPYLIFPVNPVISYICHFYIGNHCECNGNSYKHCYAHQYSFVKLLSFAHYCHDSINLFSRSFSMVLHLEMVWCSTTHCSLIINQRIKIINQRIKVLDEESGKVFRHYHIHRDRRYGNHVPDKILMPEDSVRLRQRNLHPATLQIQ